MPYMKHPHSYKFLRRINQGYLFRCNRCVNENLYSFRYITRTKFWGN